MTVGYSEYFRYAHRLFRKKNALPLYLIFFVTSRCNARCGHCFNWRRAEADHDDLSLDEYRKISAHMPRLVFMFFSGGEPFLRQDFAEIVELFHKNNHIQKVQTPSNGSLPEVMERQVKQILTRCPDLHYSITISVDAIGQEHDRLRGFPGLFERVMETHRRLKELARRYSNFGINFEITVSKNNQDSVIETYRYLRQRCDAANVFSVLIRGVPRDPATTEVDLEKYRELNRAIEADIVSGRAGGYGGFPFASLMNAKNLYSREIVYKTAKEDRYLMPCYAGLLAGNVFENGDVFPCELLDRPFGNLREWDYDFTALWRSAEAEAVRRHIRETRCYCTHECILNTNLLFNPRNLPPIAIRWAKIAMGGWTAPRER